jgi:hypothetical protein
MKQRRSVLVAALASSSFCFCSPAWGQINVGDYTISGGGRSVVCRGLQGDRARFEEYRDIPESVIVPQLQLMIGEKGRLLSLC